MRAALLAALAAGTIGLPHPMHTSVAELVHDPATRSIAVTVRVFADDFALAAGGSDSAAAAYVRARLVLTGPDGRAIPLRWLRPDSAGEALLLRLRAERAAGLSGVRVRHTLLCERFSDQVNIVRAVYAGRSASLLFTGEDQAKALP